MLHPLPQLPYAPDALAPILSRETIEFHYGRHVQTYLDNLNRLIADTDFEDMALQDIVVKAEGAIFNNAAQAWNHLFYFDSLTPQSQPVGTQMRLLVEQSFGSIEAFRTELQRMALSLFGSGWTWVVLAPSGRIEILNTQNAGTPLRDNLLPLLTIDVWEHAYYIDYRNRRAEYVEKLWTLLNWEKVEERLNVSLFDRI